MSNIKSQSLFSCTQNPPCQLSIVSKQSASKIFKSMIGKIPSKPQSTLIASVFKIYPEQSMQNQTVNLNNRIVTAGYRDHPSNCYHFIWSVCKNEYLSKEEGFQEHDQKILNLIDTQPKVKQEANQVLQQNQVQPFSQTMQQSKKVKNETKNIPKNYGKAIISFVQKNRFKIQIITERLNIDYEMFLSDLKRKKKTINTIADLRMLWSEYEYAKCMRIVSRLFLRRYALAYIFNSRICTFTSHIKYRQRLSEAVQNPEAFLHIKDY